MGAATFCLINICNTLFLSSRARTIDKGFFLATIALYAREKGVKLMVHSTPFTYNRRIFLSSAVDVT